MDRKGFTLFTALVSFVLILLSAMLVQTMIKAERDRTEVISNISEQAEMQAMADLARAEALQTFNYAIRKDMEEFFDNTKNPNNRIEIYPQDHSFEEIKENFAKRFFGVGGQGEQESEDAGEQFANQMAITMTEVLPRTKYIGPYEISIQFKGKTEIDQRKNLNTGLIKLMILSAEKGFFEVVDCENGDPKNCLGTFYLNLRIGELDDETYESFPQIKVKNLMTDRVLQESIFPRGDIKLYVPIRLFKAIAEARSLALEYKKEDSSSWKSNYGIFSPRIHNEIEEMKLGMCDPNYCNVRTNPYLEPKAKNMAQPCPNTSTFENGYPINVECTNDLLEMGVCRQTQPNEIILSYDPNTRRDSSASQQNAIKTLVANRICFLANENVETTKYLDAEQSDSFLLSKEKEFSGISCPITNNDNKKISFLIEAVTRNSVKIDLKDPGSASPEDQPDKEYNANNTYRYNLSNAPCPMSSAANSLLWGTFGVTIKNGKITKTEFNQACSEINFPYGDIADYGTCSEVSKIKIRVPFKETNPKYIVNKNKQPVYVVELIDNKFTPNSDAVKFHQKEQFVIDNSTCALRENSVSNSNSCDLDSWVCESYTIGIGGGGNSVSGGCKAS